MSERNSSNGKKSVMPSVWKNRKKPFLIMEFILILIAIILGVINLIRWSTQLPLLSSIVILLVGVVFTLRGIEGRLNKEKGYQVTLNFGWIICILAIISLAIDLWL